MSKGLISDAVYGQAFNLCENEHSLDSQSRLILFAVHISFVANT